ncbi:mucin-1-like [Colius striatus]|uniref:mucin-1-like n=1 Tax=Colius striatus TaxID=57412 RepID=UPI002B1E70DC|nr:mucin-1-like [Colius striatus]
MPPSPRRTHARTSCQPQTPLSRRDVPGRSLPLVPAPPRPQHRPARPRGSAPAAASAGRGKERTRGQSRKSPPRRAPGLPLSTGAASPHRDCLSPPGLPLPTGAASPHRGCLSPPGLPLSTGAASPHRRCLSPPALPLPTGAASPHRGSPGLSPPPHRRGWGVAGLTASPSPTCRKGPSDHRSPGAGACAAPP